MTDVTDLTPATSVGANDLLYAVVDPTGTPLDRKVTAGNLAASTPFSSRYQGFPQALVYTKQEPAMQTIAANATLTIATWSYTATRPGIVDFVATGNLYGVTGVNSAAGLWYLRDTVMSTTIGEMRWHTNGVIRQLDAFVSGRLLMPSAGSYSVSLIATSDVGSGQSMQNRENRFFITRMDF